jgi:CheY-like chemotaxis protein
MGKARILVVEDERLVALSVEKCLTNMGYEVPVTLATGEEALRRFEEIAPDLVLMDIHLKGKIDGIEAAERIRNATRIPVVYLTAYSEENTRERAKLTEPFGYITKPFEERTLQTTVEMALHKSAIDREFRRVKEKLETVLKSIDECVVVVNARGVVEYLNEPANRLLLAGDRLEPETPFASIGQILDAETLEPAVLLFDRVIAGGEHLHRSNLLLLTRDLRRIPIDCSLAPLHDEFNYGLGMVLVFRDISK